MQLAEHRTCIFPGASFPTFQEPSFDIACKAFWLALLLNQDIEVAESVVESSLETLPIEEFSQPALLAEVARTSWNRSEFINWLQVDTRPASKLIPFELRNVVELPSLLRYSFCLRVLAGISATACSQMMGLRPEEVDQLLERSVNTLATSV